MVKMVRLHTGKEVPESMARVVPFVLQRVLKKDPIAVFEFLALCRNQRHQLFGNYGKVLEEWGLAEPRNDEVVGYAVKHQTTRDVALAWAALAPFGGRLISKNEADKYLWSGDEPAYEAVSSAISNFNAILDLYDIGYDISTLKHLSWKIHDSVEKGKTSWAQLGITADDVTEQLRQGKILAARRLLVRLLDHEYAAPRCDADNIRKVVENGDATWEELGFTDEDVTQRLNRACIKCAQYYFVAMDQPHVDHFSSLEYARWIRKIMSDGIITWDELGFTDADVEKHVEQKRRDKRQQRGLA